MSRNSLLAMRRHSHELALAAGIFLAANAVYGVEALIGRDTGNTNAPMDVQDVDSGNNHPHTFSVDPSFNYDLSLEKDPHDPGLILEFGDEGKVILNISIDSNADDLLQRDMAIDRITLLIQPE